MSDDLIHPSTRMYFHVPFCLAKCRYCDFNSYPGLARLIPEYVDAVIAEAETRADDRDGLIESVYFGGGTPSLLAPGDVARILEACRRHFGLKPDAEITMEANPGTVSQDGLRRLRGLGVNRLSLGVQSFSDRALTLLGRIHSGEQARGAYRSARRAGFDNVNLDLIYGLPEQTLGDWVADVKAALDLQPEHLSLYCLTLEEETPLGQGVARGDIASPDPDLAAEMYLLAEDHLESAGYEHYEISNWARPGRACRHNVSCWRNEPYLGFGAGAHSYAGGFRFSNVMRPEDYIERLRGPEREGEYAGLGPAVERTEPISREMEIAETMILGLRLVSGVNVPAFAKRFGAGVADVYGPQVAELTSLGLLQQAGEALSLTQRGRLLGNEVFLKFLSV